MDGWMRSGSADVLFTPTKAAWIWTRSRGLVKVSVCVYPAGKALAVRAGPSEVDVRILADLIQGLGLAGNTFQIHHGNVTTLDKHLEHTMKQDQYQITAITHRWVFGCCWLVTDKQWGANYSKTKASLWGLLCMLQLRHRMADVSINVGATCSIPRLCSLCQTTQLDCHPAVLEDNNESLLTRLTFKCYSKILELPLLCPACFHLTMK